MTLILKQIATLAASLLALYGIALAVTLVLVPGTDVGRQLDAGQARSSLFMTEPKYVFLSRSSLNTTDDKVILLGASNMQVGFRQAQVQALVPGAEVHNLSVGG